MYLFICRRALTILAVLVAIAPFTGCDDEKSIGGCDTETVTSGLAFTEPSAPDETARVMYHSVAEVDLGVVSVAIQDLDETMDGLGIDAWSRTELYHHNGPCWPPYGIVSEIDTLANDGEALRQALLARTVAGLEAREGTAARFGVFFLQFNQGGEDLWTLYFHEPAGIAGEQDLRSP